MSDMTPQQAADAIDGVKWLDMHEHADALRVLIDHARAAAPADGDPAARRVGDVLMPPSAAELIARLVDEQPMTGLSWAGAEAVVRLVESWRVGPSDLPVAPEGGDLAEDDLAEELAARVQRAVGEEGDVFDFAAPERMEQADALSRELLPLAEAILDRGAPSVAAPPQEGPWSPEFDAINQAPVRFTPAAPEGGDLAAWLDQQIADVAGRVADCDRRGWDNAATSLRERRRALQDVRDRLPTETLRDPERAQ